MKMLITRPNTLNRPFIFPCISYCALNLPASSFKLLILFTSFSSDFLHFILYLVARSFSLILLPIPLFSSASFFLWYTRSLPIYHLRNSLTICPGAQAMNGGLIIDFSFSLRANTQSVKVAYQICLQNISWIYLHLFCLFQYLVPRPHYPYKDLLIGLCFHFCSLIIHSSQSSWNDLLNLYVSLFYSPV